MNQPPYSNSPGQNPYNPATGQAGYPMDDNKTQFMAHPPNATIIHDSTVMPGVIISGNLGPNPTPYFCNNCNQQIVTKTDKKPTMRTHVCAGLLCLFLCWPCICVPYCMDSFKKTEHFCPNCDVVIGIYTP